MDSSRIPFHANYAIPPSKSLLPPSLASELSAVNRKKTFFHFHPAARNICRIPHPPFLPYLLTPFTGMFKINGSDLPKAPLSSQKKESWLVVPENILLLSLFKVPQSSFSHEWIFPYQLDNRVPGGHVSSYLSCSCFGIISVSAREEKE